MRTVWIDPAQVTGRVEPGHIVEATAPLSDWCLRGDDGSAPIPAGAMLEVIELRPWGAAMAQELPELHTEDDAPLRDEIMQAALELQAEGLWEFEPLPAGARG